MKAIIFDAGPIITLTTNNVLWLLSNMRLHYAGDFMIPQSVKEELIDRPLSTKKYKFEALQVLPYISNGTLKVVTDSKIKELQEKISDIANKIYYAKGQPIRIIHGGESEAIAQYIFFNAEAFVIDERATRMLIEEPRKLAKRLKEKLHTKVEIDSNNLKEFKKYVRNVNIIRSVELITIAYELGLLDVYMARENSIYVKNIKRTLIEAVLWGVKLKGCAVSIDEINDIIRLERKYHRKR